MAVKIKPSEKQTFKSFEIELKELGLDERSKLNDNFTNAFNESNQLPKFSFWVDVIRNGTSLSDEEINKYPTEELIAIANKIFEVANKKK